MESDDTRPHTDATDMADMADTTDATSLSQQMQEVERACSLAAVKWRGGKEEADGRAYIVLLRRHIALLLKWNAHYGDKIF